MHRTIKRVSHDIGELLSLLDQSGEKIPQYLWIADDLTQYAVETRYPGPAEPVTKKEYCEAVALAAKVVKWTEKIIVAKRSGKAIATDLASERATVQDPLIG
jgi:HEPN domain-containing protein